MAKLHISVGDIQIVFNFNKFQVLVFLTKCEIERQTDNYKKHILNISSKVVDKKENAGLVPTAQNRGAISCIQMVIVQHPLLPLANLTTVKDQIVVLVDSKTKITHNQIKEGFQIRIKVHMENRIRVVMEIDKVAIHKVKTTFNRKTKATLTNKTNPISNSQIKATFNKEAIIGEDIRTITKVLRAKEEDHATLV